MAVFPRNADGSLAPASDVHQHVGSSGVNPHRQEGPHAHMAMIDAANRMALIPDLGRDEVRLYDIDLPNRALHRHNPEAVQFAPGAGPRHIAFHPSAPYAYVIGELGSTITACAWDEEAGTLQPFQVVPTLKMISATRAPAPTSTSRRPGASSTAPIAATTASSPMPSMARPAHSVTSGHTATGGRTPRNFAIDPTGTFLYAANQDTDTIVTFRLDKDTGLPEPTGHVTPVPSPVCVLLVPELG